MKNFSKLLFISLLFCTVTGLYADKTDPFYCADGLCVDSSGNPTCDYFDGPHSIILPRSQSLNSAILNFNNWLYGCGNDPCGTCINKYIGYRFSQTRKGYRMAIDLFGSQTLNFKGSLVDGRDPLNKDIFADYFGLDPLYVGSIKFNPRIRNHQFDFGARFELGNWFDCLDCSYFAIQGTLVHARWTLDPKITDDMGTKRTLNCGSTSLPNDDNDGYMSNPDQGKTVFTKSLKEALSGKFLFGDMITEWSAGRFNFNNKELTTTKLANIDLILGYDFHRDDYHVGIFLKTVAPTGTRQDRAQAVYRFNPIVGNGHYWEFGGGLTAHCDLWECDSQCISLYLDGSVTHLFKNTQWRQFGLKHPVYGSLGPNSEYMLLKQFNDDGEYKGLINAVDYTIRPFESSFSVQGDATLRLQYQSCGWFAGVGYNIYGRSEEKICNACGSCKCTDSLDNAKFALKGMTGVAYVDTFPDPDVWNNLNTSQTDYATIYGIKNSTRNYQTPAQSDFNTNCPGKNIDNPGTIIPAPTDITWDGITNAHAHLNATPKFINCEDYIDIKALPSQLIHKIFGQVGYKWEECDWQPFVSLYGDVDFAKECDLNTPIFWTIGIQGGFSF